MFKQFFLGIIISIGFSASAMAEDTLVICTPEWNYYTQKDGTGLYHQLWKEIFEHAGFQTDIRYAPFKRCKFDIEDTSGKYDVATAGYADTQGLIPKWHLGIDLISVAYRRNEIKEWSDQNMLNDRTVSWIRGYNFDKQGIITASIELKEVNDIASGLRKLAVGRIDFLIDYNTELRDTIRDIKLEDEIAVFEDVISGPKYYMIFRDNEKGRRAMQIWDEGMERLHKSGRLQEMYKAIGDIAY